MAAELLVLSSLRTARGAKKIPRPDILDEFDMQLSQVRMWRKEGKDPEDMPEWAQKIDSAARLVQREWRQKCRRRYRGGLTGLLEGDTGPCDGPAMIRTPWGWMPVNDPWIEVPNGNEKRGKSKEVAAPRGSPKKDVKQSSGPSNESNDPDPKEEEGSEDDTEGVVLKKKKIKARHGKSVINKRKAEDAPRSSNAAGAPEREKECLAGGNRKPKRNSVDKHGLKSVSARNVAGMTRARVKESLDVVLNLRRDFIKWRDSYWKVSKVAKKASTTFDSDVPSAAEFARWTATMKLHVVALVDSMAEGTPVGRAFVRDASHLVKVAKKIGRLLHDQTDVDAGIAAFHKFDKAMQENGYVCSTLLEEVEEWTDAMVGKLEGMLRDYDDEESNKHHTGAAANDVQEHAADVKPDTVLINQHDADDAPVLKNTATQNEEQKDMERHHCSINTAQAPDEQHEPSCVGKPSEGGAVQSHAADSGEQRASGHQQDSDSKHPQCQGTRTKQEEGERLTDFEKSVLLRRNEISTGVTRNHHHHQQQEDETVIPPRRQSNTSVGGGSTHSKRASLEASAPSKWRDTFSSAVPRKPSTRASMEDIRSDARTSSRLSPLLTRQPQEGGGNRRKPLRKPSRNSLDSVLKNRPNLYRDEEPEDAADDALTEETSCGINERRHLALAASPIHSIIEQPGTHQPNSDASLRPQSRKITHASTDVVQDSFTFAAPSLTSTTPPPPQSSQSSGNDATTCSVINTSLLPPLVAASPVKESGAAAAANERNRNDTGSQGGLLSAAVQEADAGNGRPVVRLAGRHSMDVGSLAAQQPHSRLDDDSAHQHQQGTPVSHRYPVHASLLNYSHFQDSYTSRKQQQHTTRSSIDSHRPFNWKQEQSSLFDGIATRQQDLINNNTLRSSQAPLENLTLPGGKVLY